MKYKNNLIIIFTAIVLTVTGCSSPPKNSACIVRTIIPLDDSNCTGMLDVYYTYVNGERPPINFPDTINFRYLNNNNLLKFYVKQENSYSCYAAAMQSAFAYFGVRYNQISFLNAIDNACFGMGSYPPTFSQILFSATRVHLSDGGIWYIDDDKNSTTQFLNSLAKTPISIKRFSKFIKTNTTTDEKKTTTVYRRFEVCKSPNTNYSYTFIEFHLNFQKFLTQFINIENEEDLKPTAFSNLQQLQNTRSESKDDLEYSDAMLNYLLTLDLYRPIAWHTSGNPQNLKGGIVPIRHSGDLIWHFSRFVPVAVGLSANFAGHVVLITKIKYYSIFPETTTNLDENAYIEWVEVMDPGISTSQPYKISGDELLSNAMFIFALYHPKL